MWEGLTLQQRKYTSSFMGFNSLIHVHGIHYVTLVNISLIWCIWCQTEICQPTSLNQGFQTEIRTYILFRTTFVWQQQQQQHSSIPQLPLSTIIFRTDNTNKKIVGEKYNTWFHTYPSWRHQNETLTFKLFKRLTYAILEHTCTS